MAAIVAIGIVATVAIVTVGYVASEIRWLLSKGKKS